MFFLIKWHITFTEKKAMNVSNAHFFIIYNNADRPTESVIEMLLIQNNEAKKTVGNGEVIAPLRMQALTTNRQPTNNKY